MYQKLISFLIKHPLRFVFIIFLLLLVKEIAYLTTYWGDVSPIADGFSEANTIRGGTFLKEKGLTYYKGLPDICYGDLLPSRGAGLGESQAYTHYPPGPEYMAWLGFNIVGDHNFNLIRFLPLLLSIIIGIFFIKTTFFMVGGYKKGVVFVLMLILPPMYSNYMLGLHHQQYAFLFLQTQMILAYYYLSSEKWKRWYTLLAFAALGFAHGWMTFDYAFLATLFVIPFYLFYRKEYQLKFTSLVSIGLCSGLSYTLAHLLHFYQVVLYYGDFSRALMDFTNSAAYRLNNAANSDHVPLKKYDPNLIGPFTVAKDFLYRVAGRGKYLSINLINYIWIILGLRFVKKITFKKGWTFEFDIRTSDLLSLFSAIIISSLWSLVMKQHAHIHGFIARHYYFAYFFCTLILITRTRKVDA